MPLKNVCPVCYSDNITTFYECKNVPVQSVVLLHSYQEALDFPKADLSLAFCFDCQFIFNRVYQRDLVDYRLENESTQRHSHTFNAFETQLALSLQKKFSLKNKTIIEIGCGQGEFLHLLCAENNNTGIGFDPAYITNQTLPGSTSVTIIPDYYTDQYKNYQPDFICCKMTLEHIDEPGNFINTIKSSLLDAKKQVNLFFQVPDAARVLAENAFWDIYYEHCSYFNAHSMKRLFENNKFNILDLWNDYDDQYLMISVVPSLHLQPSPTPIPTDHQQQFIESIHTFVSQVYKKQKKWKDFIQDNQHKTIVIWGAGSKCVSFCTTLNIQKEILYAVDINLQKNNTYLPGSGQKVVDPSSLPDINPQIVIIMNPIYYTEIKKSLHAYGLDPDLINITDL